MALSDPLVEASDLATYMRTTFASGAETNQVEMILRVVSAWARTVGSTTWTSSNVPDDVVGVVLSAARRELTNPDRVITESMGPLSVTRAEPPDGFFTAGEKAILRRKKGGALYTVSTKREDERWGVGYLHMTDRLNDEPFPYVSYGEIGYDGTIHYGSRRHE